MRYGRCHHQLQRLDGYDRIDKDDPEGNEHG
jgi:hypothetical protein